MIKYADVIIDLQRGDTGKGKVSHSLSNGFEYDYVVRYNGGANAGHTIYYGEEKIVTHLIPSGILHGKKCIIGNGCVINIKALFLEIEMLESFGIEVRSNLLIAHNAHITREIHLEDDSKDVYIGTTKKGVGPTYRDKYMRCGLRAESVDELKPFCVDLSELFYKPEEELKILFEGAQGFYLDIDWGDYPYVTSSHCSTASAFLNGIAPSKLRKVYGICKPYETYVGNKEFQPADDDVLKKLQEVGGEIGATTGRVRQVNYLNLDELIKACNINGVTNLIINKTDILRACNAHKLIHGNKLINLYNVDKLQEYVYEWIKSSTDVEVVLWSANPYSI